MILLTDIFLQNNYDHVNRGLEYRAHAELEFRGPYDVPSPLDRYGYGTDILGEVVGSLRSIVEANNPF